MDPARGLIYSQGSPLQHLVFCLIGCIVYFWFEPGMYAAEGDMVWQLDNVQTDSNNNMANLVVLDDQNISGLQELGLHDFMLPAKIVPNPDFDEESCKEDGACGTEEQAVPLEYARFANQTVLLCFDDQQYQLNVNGDDEIKYQYYIYDYVSDAVWWLIVMHAFCFSFLIAG